MIRKLALALSLILLLALFSYVAFGHGKEGHAKKSKAPTEKAIKEEKAAHNENVKQTIYRGCPACHIKVSAQENYTLANEARMNASKHPFKSPSGVILGDDTNVETCLECHGATKSGKGKNAPLPLRDIVHPAHNFSPDFRELNGNCFSCHDTSAVGQWDLLTRKVETKENGIPKKVPIKGALPIEKQSYVPLSVFIIAVAVLSLLNVISLGLVIKKRK